MISIIRPIAIGNALRIFIDPPAGATKWRVLRKASDTVGAFDDPTALNVYEGDLKVFVDAASLPNEQMAFYKPFYWIGNAWVPGQGNSGTPAAIYEDHSTDVVAFLRDRLEAGLQVECQRGNFQTDLGYVQVYTAPPSLEQGLQFPCVTIELDNAGRGESGIGEDIGSDEDDEDSDGWYEDVSISMVAWSLNPNERIELRKALRRLLIGNLSVFDDSGIQQVSLRLSDQNAVNGEFGAPVYQVLCNFTCIAPARVSARVSAIQDVVVTSTTNT